MQTSRLFASFTGESYVLPWSDQRLHSALELTSQKKKKKKNWPVSLEQILSAKKKKKDSQCIYV